jgi:UDP-GlcNAc:undecaprenyl-phosphate/decaprenyl-phosphate GlcNAc-1-phosphate transferase
MPFAVALALALVLTPVARWLGLATGVVDRPDPPPTRSLSAENHRGALKIHVRPVPVLGGAAVAIAALGALAVLGRPAHPAVVASVALALATGLTDDIRPLSPWVRFLLLGTSGILLSLSTWPAPLGLAGIAGIVGLVLACTNAVNLIDGLDALAGGLAAVASLGFAVLAAGVGDGSARGMGLALAGALLGFLVWNRPPARIFLGNGGAYAVGTLLASLATSEIAGRGWRGLLAAGACLALFAFELLFTVARRLRSRAPLTSGDREHSYDQVAARTGDWAITTFAFLGSGICTAAMAVAIGSLPLAPGVGLLGLLAGVGLVSGVLLWPRGRLRGTGRA